MNKLRALIVDDEPLARERLRGLLRREVSVEIVGECASGTEAIAMIKGTPLDLVFLDIVMPGKDGVTAATELLARHPTARVVMCTSLTTRERILACKRAGVRHYLLKPFDQARAEQVFRFALDGTLALQGVAS